MPTTLTLKNIPEELYKSLKETARINHRSLNGEAIAQLERNLVPQVITPEERLERIRKLRANLGNQQFDANDIQAAIREGRGW